MVVRLLRHLLLLLLLLVLLAPLAEGAPPQWEVVAATALPVIDRSRASAHGIFAGFETGQFMRLSNGTFYFTANELGLCDGVPWNKVTRAGLWSAPNSTGPWSRLTTLRNGSHMWSLCNKSKTPYPGAKYNLNYVTWAPTLVRAPSSVNSSSSSSSSSSSLVWNLFYSSKQDRTGDKDLPWGIKSNGISWAVSTTDSMLGPYVDVIGVGSEQGVVVDASHSFSAWRLRNGSYAGFRNNVPGASSFSAGLIAPVADGGRTPGAVWRDAGPDIAVQDDQGSGLRWAPENPVVMGLSSDGAWYYAAYDALRQPAKKPDLRNFAESGRHGHDTALVGGSGGGGGGGDNEQTDQEAPSPPPPICSKRDACDRIGLAWSADGVTWTDSTLLAVQGAGGHHACGQIRTPLGLAPEPERCRGCYSVLWTGISAGGFRPVCHAIIRNINEGKAIVN